MDIIELADHIPAAYYYDQCSASQWCRYILVVILHYWQLKYPVILYQVQHLKQLVMNCYC